MRGMRQAVALAVGLWSVAPAWAGLHVGDDQCGYRTDYDVRVESDGIRFAREAGAPAEVFMHDGRLRVDGRELTVPADDAGRLRRYEAQVRALVPEVAAIAREGVDIGFGALTTVVATFAEDGRERARLVEDLNRKHAQALRGLDEGIGSGVWRQAELEKLVEDSVEDSVGDLVGTVTAGAVKAALSGDQGRIEALEARANSLDASIQKEVDARADKLEARARLLCPRLDGLAQLQRDLHLRLADGSPLRLLERDDGHREPPRAMARRD